MQLFLKQQAKERALSASLPHIPDKNNSKTFMRNLKGKLYQNISALYFDPLKANATVTSTTFCKNPIAKRSAKSFSSFGNRQFPAYAYVQLQRQYKEWEKRRQKKNRNVDEPLTTNLLSLNTKQISDVSKESHQTGLSEDKSENVTETSKHSFPPQSSKKPSNQNAIISDNESVQQKPRVVENKIHQPLNQQHASIPSFITDVETPQTKKPQSTFTKFRDLKLHSKERCGKSTRAGLQQRINCANHNTEDENFETASLSSKWKDAYSLSAKT